MSRNFELLEQIGRQQEILGSDRRLSRRSDLGVPTPSPPALPAEAEWWRAWETLRKHWRVATTFAGAVMTAVVVVTVLTKPVYEPVARVEIDPPGAELFNLEGRESADSSPEFLETQARNMESPELLVTVMRQLQLDQVPEFKDRTLVSRTLGAGLSGLERISTGLWKGSHPDDSAKLPAGLQVLSPSEASTLAAMQSRVSVKRDTASHLVNVSFSTHDAVLSAAVTNMLVRSFIERTYETRHTAIMQSTDWLARQLDDIRAKMEQSNRALGLVRFVREEVVGNGPVRVDWHGHNDRGLGIINAIAAFEAGADQLHGTGLGIGERIGNVPMDLLLVNMRLLGYIQRDLSGLKKYCLAVSNSTGVPIPVNYPVLGSDAFRTGTGVHAAAVIKAQRKGDFELSNLVYSGVPSDWFGLEQLIEVGPMSGRSNVEHWLQKRGFECSEELVLRIFEKAKSSDHVLSESEILAEIGSVRETS